MKQVFFSLTMLAFASVCNAQANTQLSNLAATTKVNSSLTPKTNNAIDLGTNVKRWRNAYFNGTVYAYGTGATYGVYATGSTYGVYGYSASNYGVLGSSGYIGVYGSGSSYGVYASGGTYGAYGSGSSYGLYGYSASNYGVGGNSGYIGVYGNSSTEMGVYGYTGGGGTYESGVYGYCGSYGYGLRGYSVYGSGVYAQGGTWGGYFIGSVYSSGTYQGSDASLKQNIRDFGSAMDIINKLHPKQYEYKQDGNYKLMNFPTGTRYGLIANDVEKVLPGIVKDATFDPNTVRPDGEKTKASSAKADVMNFKTLNYTELIPILVKAVQELSAQNEDLKSQVSTLSQTVDQLKKSTIATSVSDALINQNFPNPFTNTTRIAFRVPEGSSANIIVSQTGSGKVVKTIPISSGASQLTFDGTSLSAGTYTYSLYIDGKKIDSKQMIINR